MSTVLRAGEQGRYERDDVAKWIRDASPMVWTAICGIVRLRKDRKHSYGCRLSGEGVIEALDIKGGRWRGGDGGDGG